MSEAGIDAAALDELLASFDGGTFPGVAIGVAFNGKPGFQRSFGTIGDGMPIMSSPATRIRLTATLRHFMALAVMLLAEEGRLSIDDPSSRHMSELTCCASNLTIRQLIACSSGMRNELDPIFPSAKPDLSDCRFEALGAPSSVALSLGGNPNGDDGRYELLSGIVSQVGGRPPADFLRDRIFRPLGMNDTHLCKIATEPWPNSVSALSKTVDGGRTGAGSEVQVGGDGIVSNVDDLLRWLAHMDAPVVGTLGTWATIRTPLAPHNYHFGLATGTHRGFRTEHHVGAVVSGSCRMLKVPAHKLDVVVISNEGLGAEVTGLVNAIIDSCVKGSSSAHKSNSPRIVTGDFWSPATARRISLVEAGGLQAIRIGRVTLPSVRRARGGFNLPFGPTGMWIVPASDGESLALHDDGRVDTLTRVKDKA